MLLGNGITAARGGPRAASDAQRGLFRRDSRAALGGWPAAPARLVSSSGAAWPRVRTSLGARRSLARDGPLLEGAVRVLGKALALARASAWSYDRCDGQQGPDSWPSSSKQCPLLAETTAQVVECGEQSPIDLCAATDMATLDPPSQTFQSA